MRKTILLADDSVTIQKVVELTFLDEDFEVVAVSNGTQALARLEEMTPDLVIADVHMPGASGLEVCRQSKRQRPRIPVLLLVGTFEPFDAAEATAAGSDDYLKKPFDSQELLRRAKDLIARGGAGATPSMAPAVATQPAAPLLSAEPQSVLTSWDDSPFALEGDGSTRFEPPAELDLASEFVLEPEVPEPAPLEPSLVLPVSAPMALPVEAPVVEALPAPVFAAPPAEIPAVAPAREVLAPAGELRLADSDIERIARRVVELLGPQVLRDVAWEVVPDLAEVAIRARIRELEAELE